MTAFKTFRTPNRELGLLQDNIRDALQDISDSLIVEGVQIGPVTIGTTATTIAHTLNRMPLGYFVVKKSGPGDIYDMAINASNLTLVSSSQVRVSIWVY